MQPYFDPTFIHSFILFNQSIKTDIPMTKGFTEPLLHNLNLKVKLDAFDLRISSV